MLEVANLTKSLGGRKVVDNLTFTLDRGQVLGLIGANGAGKSTTVSMIATLMKPDGGTITYDGEDTVHNPAALRRVMGFVPQDIALYETLTGLENMRFWGKSYGIAGEELDEAVERVAAVIGFDGETLKRRVSTYSGGMKRRINIGVALLHNPELIILDEPTTGVDIQSADQILAAIEQLRQNGMAVLYVGHYLEELERIATHVCIMNEGRCVAFGSREELLANAGGQKTLAELYRELCSGK